MIILIATSEVVGKIGHYKWLLIISAIIAAVSPFLLSMMTPDLPIWVLCSYLAVMGIGLSACMQILVVIVQNSLSQSLSSRSCSSAPLTTPEHLWTRRPKSNIMQGETHDG